MKRLINVRLPVLLTCALAAGVAFGFLFIYFNINLFWLTAIIPVTAVIFIICTVITRKTNTLIFIFLTAAFLVAGTLDCYYRLNSFIKDDIVDGETYTVTANVYEKGENSYGEYIVLDGVTAGGQKLNGKVTAYLSAVYGDFCDVGYKVTFTAVMHKKQVFSDGKPSFYALESIKYSCSVRGNLTAKYAFSLFGSIRSAARKTLYGSLDKDTAAIVYAMLTGDTQGIDEGAMTSFRYGGIAHIFAVSGLHIGIIYGFLYLLGKKAKLNKFILSALCIFFIFLYAGVCGFSPSSVRAAVMCAVYAIAKLAYKKHDGINALALAVILILLVQPLSLFAAGFQLSVCAVCGIHFSSKKISRPFKKLPPKLGSSLGVSISAQLWTMPVMLTNFGYISGIGLLLNIVVIPVLSVLFVIFFICTLIAALFSFTAVILPYVVLPLELIVSFLLNAGFENAIIGASFSALSPTYFALLIVMSDKINAGPLHRAYGVLFSVLLACVLIIF